MSRKTREREKIVQNPAKKIREKEKQRKKNHEK